MRAFRTILAGAAAAVFMLSCQLTCFAEDDNYAVTTTTGTSAEGQGGVVWTQITEESKQADNNAVQLSVSVSAIKDKKFTADINVQTKQSISYIEGSIGFDTKELKLAGAQPQQAAGGEINGTTTEGKYLFKYVNPQGSSYNGSYIKLDFELIGDDTQSDVLFLTVDSLLDNTSQALEFNKADGIVNPSDSPKISLDVKTIRISVFPRPYTFEELGFADVINCEMEESDVAKYSEDGIVAMTPGTVNAELIFKDYSKQKIKIDVYNSEAQDSESDSQYKAAVEKEDDKPEPQKAKKSVNIGVPILLLIAFGFAYLLVSGRQKKRRPVSGNYEPRYRTDTKNHNTQRYRNPVDRNRPW